MANHTNSLKGFRIKGKNLFSYIFRKIMTFLSLLRKKAKAVLCLSKAEASFQNVLFPIFLKMNVPPKASSLKRHIMLSVIFGNLLLSLSGKSVKHDMEEVHQSGLPFAIFPKKRIQGIREGKALFFPLSKLCNIA